LSLVLDLPWLSVDLLIWNLVNDVASPCLLKLMSSLVLPGLLLPGTIKFWILLKALVFPMSVHATVSAIPELELSLVGVGLLICSRLTFLTFAIWRCKTLVILLRINFLS